MSDNISGVHIGIVRQVEITSDASDDNGMDSQYLRVYVPGIDSEGAVVDSLPVVQVVLNPSASKGAGHYTPLRVDDKVLVMFFGTDISLRCIIGRYYALSQVPGIFRSNYPNREGFLSQQGHALIFDNEADLDAGIPGGVSLLSSKGISLEFRDAWNEVRLTTESGSKFILRGSNSDADDDDTVNKGVIVESVPDNEGKKFTIQVDDENGEATVTSREGYTVTIRDTDQAGGSEKKGITIRTTADRSITIDEQTGKLYIKHDGEVIVEGSKTIIDSDLDVNGKIVTTGDIEGGGKVVAAGNVESTTGAVKDVMGNLSTHTHLLDIPHNVTIFRTPGTG